jgi:metallo-beta-lactamase family protein
MLKHPESLVTTPRVTFLGAAQAVSGSMHLLEFGPYRFLLDCGANHRDKDRGRQNGGLFPFDPESIDAVFLSHAHVDHCGNLPNLIRQGFQGPIYSSFATCDLIEIMLNDSARIHERKRQTNHGSSSRHAELFGYEDVERTMEACVGLEYGQPIQVNADTQIEYTDAGHILGSATIAISLRCSGRDFRVVFTGDLGRRGVPFVCEPSIVPSADLIVCESTYGGRTHDSLEVMADKISTIVNGTLGRGGKLLVPAFSLGRTQIVLHYFQKWMADGTIPTLPIFIDNPVASQVSLVHDLYPNLLEPEINTIPFDWIDNDEEAEQCSTQRDPCIILASGGMCEGGRIVPHLLHHIDDPRSTILLVSYQGEGTVGSQLLSRSPTVSIQGRMWNKWIEVAEIKGFSGHADQADFEQLLSGAVSETSHVRLVHGEIESMNALQSQLTDLGFRDVVAPKRNELVELR